MRNQHVSPSHPVPDTNSQRNNQPMPETNSPQNTQPIAIHSEPQFAAPLAPSLQRAVRRVFARYFGSTDMLIAQKQAFAVGPRQDKFFFRAMKENFAKHFLGCDLYRQRCLQAGVTPLDIHSYADIWKIPYVFVTVFKRNTLITDNPDKVVLSLTSSGTGGERSAIHLDARSLRRVRRLVHNICECYGMTSREATNYLCFTYDPRIAKDLGTAFSDELLTRLTKVRQVHYAIRPDANGEWFLDQEACFQALEAFERDGSAFRILGFPAHTLQVLRAYVENRGRTLHFNNRSFILTGGGWKTLKDQEIPKADFRREVAGILGIPPQNIRDLYGMVEHGVPYIECECGNMHVPIHSRVVARDPGDLRILPEGETGILHFLTPYLSSFPALSLLTTDVGHVQTGCPCGRTSPVVFLEGRGGVTRHKGCAIAALDILAPKEP